MELNMEELERKIAEDVMKELEAKGATIIPQVYEGTHNTLKAIAKYDDFLVKHGVEKERIIGRYSEKVAQEKLAELNTDLMLERDRACEELDRILEKDRKYRAEAIANKQLNADYRIARSEAINLFIALKDVDLEADLVASMISPLVEAKDLNTLKVINKLVKSNNFVLTGAIRNVENYVNNADLKALVNQAKNFIRSGATEKNITFRTMLHNVRNK